MTAHVIARTALVAAPFLLPVLGVLPPAFAATTLFEVAGLVDEPIVPTTTRAVAVSPGSEHVYVIDSQRDVIFVYERDPGDGLLTLVEMEPNENLDLNVASDGAHVYAAGGGSIHIYARDAGSGALTAAGSMPSTGGYALLSPNGEHLYAVSAPTSTIEVFERDAGTGALVFVESQATFTLPPRESAAFSPDGAHLYFAVGGFVRTLERDLVTGELDLGTNLMAAVRDLAIDAGGQNLYACDVEGDAIVVFDRNLATGALTSVQTEPLDDACGRLRISPDDAHVYVIDDADGSDPASIRVLERDAGSGEVTEIGMSSDRIGASDKLAFAPDGAHAYAIEDGAVRIFERDVPTGDLAFVDGFFSFDDAYVGAISPDGSHVYLATTSAGGYEDRLGVFSRDPVSGALSHVETEFDDADGVDGLRRPRQVVVSSDGANVYTVSRSDDLAVFARDPVTGELDFIETQPVALGSWSIAVSPDGVHVYAGPGDFFGDGTIDVFARDGGTGALTPVDAVSLVGNAVVAVSPDGAHVYAAGFQGFHAYARDAGTGALSLLSSEPSIGGTAILVSPDGKHVYVAESGHGNFVDGEVHVLARDALTGEVSLVETESNGSEGVYKLNEIDELATSPDGAYVFTAGVGVGMDGALHVFRRDPISGKLAFVLDAGHTLDPSPAISPRSDVFVDPSGTHVYRLGVPGLPSAEIYVAGFGCAEEPLPGCRTAAKSKVSVSASLLDFKDRLTFSWAKGEETSAAEFSPISNPFAFCAYDESGPNPELALVALAPAGEDCRLTLEAPPKDCWKTTSKTSKLKDPWLTPDGLDQVVLKHGPDEKASIVIKGRSENLRLPDLPLGLPLRVQLQAASGLCWETLFETASRNDDSRFNAKTD